MLNIELRQLEIFQEVVRSKSFSAAGRKLYLSQSTVSTQIIKLEKCLGMDLFHRSSQGIILTSDGQRFFEDVTQILLLIEHAGNRTLKSGAEVEGDLIVQLTHTAYIQILPEIILPFSGQYPQIRILFKTSMSPETFESISNSTAHVGIVRMPVPVLQDARFQSVLLYKDTSTLVVTPGHHFTKRESVTMAEIAKESLLFYANTTNYWVQVYSAFTQKGLQPIVKMNLDYLEGVLEMVSLGMGVSFLPTRTTQDAIKLGKVVAVPVSDCSGLERYTLAIYKALSLRYMPLKCFIDFISPGIDA